MPAIRAELRDLTQGGDEDTESMCNLTQYVEGSGRGTLVVLNGLSFRNAVFASGNDALTRPSRERLK